jgi:hypothetical protein
VRAFNRGHRPAAGRQLFVSLLTVAVLLGASLALAPLVPPPPPDPDLLPLYPLSGEESPFPGTGANDEELLRLLQPGGPLGVFSSPNASPDGGSGETPAPP